MDDDDDGAVDESATPSSPSGATVAIGSVEALQDFTASDALGLSFQRGETITVYACFESGWWDGEIRQKRGWFPSNFTTPLHDPKEPKGVWSVQKNSTGKTYYYNSATGQSVWERPASFIAPEAGKEDAPKSTMSAAAAADKDDDDDDAEPPASVVAPPPSSRRLPPGWTVHEAVDGKEFYYNRALQKASWTIPDEGPPSSPVNAVVNPETDPLPQNWGEKILSDGRRYYYNRVTNETTWNRSEVFSPSTAAAPAGSASASSSASASASASSPAVAPKPKPAATNKLDEALKVPPLGKAGKPIDSAWDSSFRNILKVVSRLNDASKVGKKHEYVPLTKTLFTTVSDIFKASNTLNKQSNVIRANKTLAIHQRELRDNLDKLVLAAKLASAIWPAPDSVPRMQQVACEIVSSARKFVTTAIDLGIQLDVQNVLSSPPKQKSLSPAKSMPMIPLPSLAEDPAVPDPSSSHHHPLEAKSLEVIRESTEATELPPSHATLADRPKADLPSKNEAESAAESAATAAAAATAERKASTESTESSRESMDEVADLLMRTSKEAENALRRISQVGDEGDGPSPGVFRARRSPSMDQITPGRLSSHDRSISTDSFEISEDEYEVQIVKLEHYCNLVLSGVQELVKLVKSNLGAGASLVTSARSIVSNSGQILSLVDEIQDAGHEQGFAECKKNLADNVTGLDYSINVASDPLAPADAYKRVLINTELVVQSVHGVLLTTKEAIARRELAEEEALKKEFQEKARLRESESMEFDKASIDSSSSSASAVYDVDDDELGLLVKRKNSKNLSRLLGEDVAPEEKKQAAKLNKFFGENVGPESTTPSPVKSAQPKFLSDEFTPQQLVYNMEGKVKAGTPEALVEYLTLHSKLDSDFVTAFLLTYRSFMTTEELLEHLTNRFLLKVPSELNERDQKLFVEQKLTPIRLRVINFLKSWIENYYGDFAEPEAGKLLKKLIDEIKAIMPNPADNLKHSIEKKNKGTISKKMIFSGKAPLPIVSFGKSKEIKFLDVDPLEIARQFTIIESRTYNKIEPNECLNKGWSKDAVKKNQAPNIQAMIDQSNKVTAWLVETVLNEKNIKTRCSTVKHFILIADKCRQLNNFNTMMSILAGLDSAPIHRLQRTWLGLSVKTTKIYKGLRDLMDSASNFSNYRKALHSVNPPCIPFLGFYLTDLTFIEDGNKDFVNKMINFDKRLKCAIVIREIQQYQMAQYCLQPVAAVAEWLSKCMSHTTPIENMYQLSLDREPRESMDEIVVRTLTESGLF